MRVLYPKGAARAALSVHSIGPGNLRGGARGGAAGENSGTHLGAHKDHRIRRTPLGILLGLGMGRFGLHLPTTPSARARIRVGHECSDLDRRSRLGNDGLSRPVVGYVIKGDRHVKRSVVNGTLSSLRSARARGARARKRPERSAALTARMARKSTGVHDAGDSAWTQRLLNAAAFGGTNFDCHSAAA